MATMWSRSRDLDLTPTFGTHVVASLDKALYDDYLCLVGSNKQQIKCSQRINRKTRKWTTPKRVWIRPKYNVTVAFSWQEDKEGTSKQFYSAALQQG